MCGINGFTWSEESLVQSMNSTIKHRGPDSEGVYVDKEVSLGHVRLSIIDPTAAADQPMFSHDQSKVLIFNGEIYNFKALKEELQNHYTFKTQSDTEVILAGYAKWGKAVFGKLNGIYAIAIWDKITRELFLSRDIYGVKPLYYHTSNKKLVFSSEVKSILAAGVEATLDHEAFNYYWRLRYVPAPLTMFKGIKMLKPGHMLCVKEGEISEEVIVYEEGEGKTVSSTRDIVADAVARQVVSDKPVGVFLSGGVDSTIVTYEAKRHIKDLHSFSTIFELENTALSERFNVDASIAEQTAKHLGTIHHKVVLNGASAVTNLEKIVWHMDVPVPSMTMFSQYEIARYAKEYVDVALGGDGGDEFFAGYHRYRYARMMDFYQKLPKNVRHKLSAYSATLAKLSVTGVLPVIQQFALEESSEIQPVLKQKETDHLDRFLATEFSGDKKSYVDLLMDFDQRYWLPDFSLIRSDKLSMANGLELRVPFLDYSITTHAESLPVNQKIGFFLNKKALRKAYADVLPASVRKAPKRGWISPGSKWFREPTVKEYFQIVLSPAYYSETAELFDWDNIQRYFIEHTEGGGYHYNTLLSVAVFQIWARNFSVKI